MQALGLVLMALSSSVQVIIRFGFVSQLQLRVLLLPRKFLLPALQQINLLCASILLPL